MTALETPSPKPKRRRWQWLFVALLPCSLFAAPSKRQLDPRKLMLSRAYSLVKHHWTPDSQSLILSGDGEEKSAAVELWNITNSPPRSRVLWKGLSLWGPDYVFSPDAKRIACDSLADKTLMFGLASKQTFQAAGKHPIFSDNEHLVTIKDDNGILEVNKYKIGQNKPLWTTIIKPPKNSYFASHTESINLPDTGPTPDYWSEWAWAISPDGSRGAVLLHTVNAARTKSQRSGVLIFETKMGRILRQIPATGARGSDGGEYSAGKASLGGLEFASDSRRLIVKGDMKNGGGGYNAYAKGAPTYKQIWDTYTGRLEQRFHYKGVKPGSYPPMAPKTDIAKWTGKNGKQYKIKNLTDFSFSPDKKWLFTKKLNNFSLWNIEHGKRLCSSRKIGDYEFPSESFSPDNKVLAVTCNRTLFLYRLQ